MDIIITFLHFENKDVTLADGLPFLRRCTPHNIYVVLLLFIGWNTTAIIVPGQNTFYLFDSHSLDDLGFCV